MLRCGNVEVIRKRKQDVPKAYRATAVILPISTAGVTQQTDANMRKETQSNTTQAFVDVVRNYQFETKDLRHIPMA